MSNQDGLNPGDADIEYIVQRWKENLYLVHYRSSSPSDDEWVSVNEIPPNMVQDFNSLSKKERRIRRLNYKKQRKVPVEDMKLTRKPYSFNYDDMKKKMNKEAEEKSRVSKKIATPEKWKRNNYVKKKIVERGPCKWKCFNIISKEKREHLRQDYRTSHNQAAWLSSCIVIKNINKKRQQRRQINLVKKGIGCDKRKRKRKVQFQYGFNIDGYRTPVCLKALLAILGISSWNIDNLHANYSKGIHGETPRKISGGHNKTAPDMLLKIKKHIDSFPRTKSHYTVTEGERYLSAELSVLKMFNLFLEKYQPQYRKQQVRITRCQHNNEKFSEPIIKKIVNKNVYYEEFNKTGYRFGEIKVDQCNKCVKFKNDLARKQKGSQSYKKVECELNDHLYWADVSYKMQRHDDKLATHIEDIADEHDCIIGDE